MIIAREKKPVNHGTRLACAYCAPPGISAENLRPVRQIQGREHRKTDDPRNAMEFQVVRYFTQGTVCKTAEKRDTSETNLVYFEDSNFVGSCCNIKPRCCFKS